MKKLFILSILIVTQMSFAQQVMADTTIIKLLNAKVSSATVPGMAAAIIYKDAIYYGTAGTISNKSTDVVTKETLFHIGSNTKAFTSLLAFQAIEQGKLSLETSFFTLFPELKSTKNTPYHNITLKDLLSHQAQVQPFTAGNEINQISITKTSLPEKRIEFSEQLLQLNQVEKGTYSNAGYVLAAMMIEKAEQKSFEDVLKDFLNTQVWDYSYGFPNKKDIKNAWGHWDENNTLVALAPNHEYQLPDYMLPAGDLSMNIVHYAQWLQLHLKGLNTETTLLSTESFNQMHFDVKDYSYGWGNADQMGQKLSFHDGSTGTFYTHTILIPDEQIGITIFANAADDKHVEAIYALQQEFITHLKTIVDAHNSKP